MRRCVRELLNLIAPVSCSGCGRLDITVCPECWNHMAQPLSILEEPLLVNGRAIPVFSGGTYSGVRQSMILDFKNGSKRKLAPLLLGLHSTVGRGLSSEGSAATVITPVPASRWGTWGRGYSPSLLLAQSLGGILKNAQVVPLVTHRLSVSSFFRNPSTPRNRQERLARSSKHYRVVGASGSASVVLVDDVMVTGASVRAVAGCLMEEGYGVRAVVVAAHIP